jgi:hypothetical protein
VSRSDVVAVVAPTAIESQRCCRRVQEATSTMQRKRMRELSRTPQRLAAASIQNFDGHSSTTRRRYNVCESSRPLQSFFCSNARLGEVSR